jgi:hypothetical protein
MERYVAEAQPVLRLMANAVSAISLVCSCRGPRDGLG